MATDIIVHAIEVYGFLIPRGTRVTAQQFSQLISNYSVHERCQVIAQHVAQSGLTFTRHNHGVSVAS